MKLREMVKKGTVNGIQRVSDVEEINAGSIATDDKGGLIRASKEHHTKIHVSTQKEG